MKITSFTCTCGARSPKDARFYDGMLGYEALVCKVCGRYYDHNGEHPADDFSKQFVNLKTTFMDTKPFDHGFTQESMKAPKAFEVIGYNKAMVQFLDYLKEITQFKPEKRFIDAVPLIEKIGATATELSKLYEAIPARNDDQKKVEILSGTKTEN